MSAIIGPNGRLPKDKGSDLCTKAQAQAEAIKVSEFYMQQIPGLVAHMLGEAFKAAGIVLPPPPAIESAVSPDATGDTATSAEAAP